MRKIFKKFVLTLFFLSIIFLSYNAGFIVGKKEVSLIAPAKIINSDPESFLGERVDFSIFWEAWRKLEKDFLDKEKIDYQAMVYGAIKGMVDVLDDPYTSFFNPVESDDFNEELSGKYEGVGMEVSVKDDNITIVSPFEGTPAAQAGIKPGDIILEVDGTSTSGLSLEKTVGLIKGESGTEVVLLIERKGWESPREIILKRATIKIPTLKWEIIERENGSSVALIKMYQFNGILVSELKRVSDEILNSSAQKIILDLRNNPGGYLNVAQEIAGWFLEKGEVVVWEDFGQEKEKKSYKAQGPSKFVQYPTVVLINGGSASASEILAGALRDNRGIKLVGDQSFGKGSVQEQTFLLDNSSLKITIAKWLTPKGDLIDKMGLTPDIEISLDEELWLEGGDSQLNKGLEIIDGM